MVSNFVDYVTSYVHSCHFCSKDLILFVFGGFCKVILFGDGMFLNSSISFSSKSTLDCVDIINGDPSKWAFLS